MPISRRYVCGDVQIAVWAIEESPEQLGKMLGDDAVWSRALTFGSDARRAEWLAVRLLLRELAGSGARMEYTAEGKPFLVGASGYISVSHTRGFAALAYSRSEPLGLDVELETRNARAACSYVMRDADFARLPREGAGAYMLLCWTAYEALYKLAGGGEYKKNLSFPLFLPARVGCFSLTLQGGDALQRSFAVSYVFDDGLLLTLCVAGGSVPQFVRLACKSWGLL